MKYILLFVVAFVIACGSKHESTNNTKTSIPNFQSKEDSFDFDEFKILRGQLGKLRLE